MSSRCSFHVKAIKETRSYFPSHTCLPFVTEVLRLINDTGLYSVSMQLIGITHKKIKGITFNDNLLQ